MGRFLEGVFADERKDAQTRRASSIAPWYRGRAYVADWNVERAVKDGYERSIWVFRSVDAIATNASKLPIIQVEGGEDGPPVRSPDPVIRLLNRKANEWETAAQFRYRLSSQLLLSKRGAFIEVNRARSRAAARLTLLPPQYTAPVPDADLFISKFQMNILGTIEDVPAEDVAWVRKPHPLDPYSGMTPMQPSGLSIDLDFYARLYNRTFLQNDGRPGGIVAVKGELDEGDGDELKRRFSGGSMAAGRVSVIEADEISYIDASVSPRDAQYVQGQKSTKEDILMSFGVPESIIGNASGRTYDNAKAEKSVFWQETMTGHLDLLGGAYDELTMGKGGDDLFVVHDTRQVDVLQAPRQADEAHEAEMIKGGLKTQDEGRKAVKLEPFDVPASKALWMLGTYAPVTQLPGEEVIPVSGPVHVTEAVRESVVPGDAAAPTGDPASGGGDTLPALPAPDVAAAPPKRRPFGEAGQSPAETKSRQTEIEDARRANERWGKTIAEAFRRNFKRQETVAISRLRSVKVRRGTRHWKTEGYRPGRPPGERKINGAELFDRGRWNEELRADFRPVVEDIYAEKATAAGLKWGRRTETKGIEPGDPDYEAAMENRLAQGDLVNETTQKKLQDTIAQGDSEGESLDDLEGRVHGVFDEAADSRAEEIGGTNAVGAGNEGLLLSASEYGDLVSGKTWFSAQDGLVRPAHQDADGQTVGMDESFDVDGEALDYPGDPNGSPGNIVNCRCTMLLELASGGEVEVPSPEDAG